MKSRPESPPRLGADSDHGQRYLLLDRGYIRMRLTLNNGDFLELSEYVVLEATALTTVTYRYQWMAAEQGQLRKRWDKPRTPAPGDFPITCMWGRTIR